MCSDEKSAVAGKRLKQVRSWAGDVSLKTIDGTVGKRLKSGKCIGCGQGISSKGREGEEDAVYHARCAAKARKEVNEWVSSHRINLTHHDKYGRNKNGKRYYGCGCVADVGNTHGMNCGYAGQRFTAKQKEGLE